MSTAFTLPRADGVLPAQWIRKAIGAGIVTAADPIPDRNIQPASLDLRLGDEAYRLRASFLAGATTVERKLEEFAVGPPIDLRNGAILERNRPYLIPLQERLALPENLRALANPKSSTGRLDVFTRVITDHSFQFDEIRKEYHGQLWLEVVPRSFTIMVRTGITLNQLRLRAGDARVSDDEVRELHKQDTLLYRGETPVSLDNFRTHDGLFLSLDLRHEAGRSVGWEAKRNSRLLDLSRLDHYDPEEFWDPVYPGRDSHVVLEPEAFYLLLSDEAVRIPPSLAAEMTAYDPTSGELRTHYAGFFDPGFGHDPIFHGSRAALEIRAHDVAFAIEHRQRVCKLRFERMLEEPDITYGAGLGSNYQAQEATLSKHFKFERTKLGGQLAIDLEP
ncbi:MAG: 2'-deoxycytidine 5'-triphosphate deaminase [Actinomycetota bacterium]|nr:2'-deoxycytidine 5'-triphosphate deaminase [Actinomycetota bacterium]